VRAGKLRVFAMPNALKQALLRPAHDWTTSVLRFIPNDGTFNQLASLPFLSGCMKLRSFDLSSATDRFPLEFQRVVFECLFNRVVAHAWVESGLGVNLF